MANMIFNLDLNKNNAINPIIFGRLTDGNLRKITVNITNEGEPVNLTDWVIRFEGATGGQAKVFDTLGVHLLDAENGKFEYTFSKTAFSATGAYRQAYFAIEKDNMRETTNDIKIVVDNVADLNAQDAETVVTELNKTITLINQKYAELNSRVDIYEGDIAELESWLDERKAEIEDLIDLANSNFTEKLSEIQAKLDETNQAIEKGSETIAYANSADGTDRFTTVYPNLNLLKNTKIIQGNIDNKIWASASASSLSAGSNNGIKVINNGGVVGSLGGFSYINTPNVNAGDTITVSCFVKNTGMVEIKKFELSIAFYGTSNSYPAKGNLVIPNDGKPYFFSFTTIVPSGAARAYTRWFDTATAVNEQHIFEVYGMKLELGSVATPWMPSASEVTADDYPKYIGYSNTVKTNKTSSDYKWFPTIDSHINDKSNPHAVTAEQVNAYTKAEVANLINQAKLDINPVGSIITTISDTNPSSYLGGIWERYGQGRALVGVDENDDDFNEANKTGGEKTHALTVEELPSHNHAVSRYNPSGTGFDQSQRKLAAAPNNGTGVAGATETATSGGDKAHNNMQPYISVYMFRRTA